MKRIAISTAFVGLMIVAMLAVSCGRLTNANPDSKSDAGSEPGGDNYGCSRVKPTH